MGSWILEPCQLAWACRLRRMFGYQDERRSNICAVGDSHCAEVTFWTPNASTRAHGTGQRGYRRGVLVLSDGHAIRVLGRAARQLQCLRATPVPLTLLGAVLSSIHSTRSSTARLGLPVQFVRRGPSCLTKRLSYSGARSCAMRNSRCTMMMCAVG